MTAPEPRRAETDSAACAVRLSAVSHSFKATRALDAVGRGEPLPGGAGVGHAAQGDQLVHHLADPQLGERVMSDHAVAGCPMCERAISLPVGIGQFKDPLALGG